MSGNPLLKIFIPLVVIAVFAVIFMSARNDPKATGAGSEGLTLSADEARDLGIEGDTSADTLRTLIGEIKRTRGEVEAMREQNRKLFEENQRLLARDQTIDARIAGEVDKARQQFSTQSQQVQHQAQNLLEQLQNKMDTLSGLGDTLNGALDVPVGLGLSKGDGETFSGMAPAQSLIWVQPLDAIPADPRSGAGGGFVFPHDFSLSDHKAVQTVAERSSAPARPRRTEQTRAVYTIPENATLTGSITMTALLGRVPIDGTVNDPYPFKVLIGKDNLTANGIELPDVQGAVMSGTATGDWTLSCVRGQIESITLVFDDGTVRTLPTPEDTVTRGASRTSGDGRIRGGIGYLSDPFGVPCIVGRKKSNAAEYLGNQGLLTAAGAAVASAFSKDDKGNRGSGSGNTIVSDRNQAFNTILSQGVGDIREWMGKLYGQAFAAVYVPPQQPVAVHIEQELAIDYEPYGRKLISDHPIDPVHFPQAALD